LSRSVFLLRSFFDLQLHEFFDNLFAVVTRLHFIVFADADDVQNLAVLAHDESDSRRESARAQDAVGFGDFGVRVTEDWVVEFQ
jgi:hypothetical protein